jgi:hypothetical protein
VVKSSFVLRIKFSAGRQFSASKSPTSCSRKTLAATLDNHTTPQNMLTDFFKSVTDKFKKKETDDLYYGYYLFGLYTDKPIWDWTIWKECMPLIQPVIDLSPDMPTIKSEQAVPVAYGKDNQFVSYNKSSLRFGRMIYNEKSNEKWTTKYINETNWTFFDTEIVFPTFTYCEKNKVHPDIFIKISNENLTGSAQPKINQSLIILFKTKLADDDKLKIIEHNIKALSDKLNVVLSGKITRPVKYPSEYLPELASTDYIRDGSHGVVDYDTSDFSERFKKYGMQTIKKGSR